MKTGLLRIPSPKPLPKPLYLGFARRPQELPAYVLVPLFGERLKNLPLPPGQLLGHHDPNTHHEVPGLAVASRTRGPGPAHLKTLAILRPRRQSQLHRPAPGTRRLDLRPERSFDEADRHVD